MNALLKDTDRMVTDIEELRVTRLPGEFGPVLRCFGELSAVTLDVLRQELSLLMPLRHPVLTINLNGCSFLDSDGVLTLFHASKRLRREGQRLVVVAGPGFAAHLLQLVRFDRVVPVFATEEAAVLAMRGGPPLLTPATWGEARALTVLHWLSILTALDHEEPEEVLRLLTSVTPMCERAGEFFRIGLLVLEGPHSGEAVSPAKGDGQEEFSALPGTAPDGRPDYRVKKGSPAGAVFAPRRVFDLPSTRCEYCPLFAVVGGGVEDLGCQSLLNPIIQAVRGGDLDLARAQVAAVIRLLEALCVPVDEAPLMSEAAD